MKPIAEVTFRTSGPRDDERRVRIRIDAPRRVRTGEWACRVTATGVVRRTMVRGEDGLQALCLAVEFLGDKLYEARKRGVRLRFDTGHEVPLFAYFRLRELKRRFAMVAGRHPRAGVRSERRRRPTSA
jgi:hypothetical protein